MYVSETAIIDSKKKKWIIKSSPFQINNNLKPTENR
jgi:hypothetical protein